MNLHAGTRSQKGVYMGLGLFGKGKLQATQGCRVPDQNCQRNFHKQHKRLFKRHTIDTDSLVLAATTRYI